MGAVLGRQSPRFVRFCEILATLLPFFSFRPRAFMVTHTDVLEAIGPESMDAITSLLEELHLTDNLTGDLLATGA